MRKWCALLLSLVMMTVLLTACGETDPEKIAATVLAEVNGEQITKGEAQRVYDFVLKQTVTSYAQNGQVIDPTAKDVVSQIKTTVLNILVETRALDQKLTELGNGFTDEDRAAMKTTAQEEYEATVADYVQSMGTTEEEARVALDNMGYSVDAFEFSDYTYELETRLRPYAVEGITLDDSEIQAQYDTLVAEAQNLYASNPSQFVTDMNNGATVYAHPEGFRFVKNLVIAFDEETETKLNEKYSEGMMAELNRYSAQMSLSTNQELTDEERLDLEAKVGQYTEDVAAAQLGMDTIIQEGHEAVRPQAEEVLAKAKEEGVDFDALMTEYSADNPTGSPAERGYVVGEGVTNYVDPFTEGAMALETIGDVSDLIESDYGFHILKYVGDIPGGAVPLELVRDAVIELTQQAKEEEQFSETLGKWINDAKVKTWINRF